MQGVVDYVTLASVPVQTAKIPVGAVFFADANQRVGRGYDSRLQMWNRFPETIDRYPMEIVLRLMSKCVKYVNVFLILPI